MTAGRHRTAIILDHRIRRSRVDRAGCSGAAVSGLVRKASAAAGPATIVSDCCAAVSVPEVAVSGCPPITVDLKDARAVELVLDLVEQADALIEGFRPGVTERLGLGPDVCLARNPKLVYGRLTGWGQSLVKVRAFRARRKLQKLFTELKRKERS